MEVIREIRELSENQFGLVARRQLTAAGIDRKKIERRVRWGELEVVTQRVLRLVGGADIKGAAADDPVAARR